MVWGYWVQGFVGIVKAYVLRCRASIVSGLGDRLDNIHETGPTLLRQNARGLRRLPIAPKTVEAALSPKP